MCNIVFSSSHFLYRFTVVAKETVTEEEDESTPEVANAVSASANTRGRPTRMSSMGIGIASAVYYGWWFVLG